MSVRRETWAAGLLLAGLLTCLIMTLEYSSRKPIIDPSLQNQGPTWTCPSGFDETGGCVLQGLVGGVHSFMGPGLIAALIAVGGGLLGGLGLAYVTLDTRDAPHRRASGYPDRPVQRATHFILILLESLPRLALLILVYVLSRHSLSAMAVALGLSAAPALANEVAERIRRLEQSEYIAAARVHGVPEMRVLLHHIVWLSCRTTVLRHMISTFAVMLVAQTSLSYALQRDLSTTEQSWGSLLRLHSDVVMLTGQRLSRAVRQASLEGIDLWQGVPQFLWIAGAIMAVLWALSSLGNRLAMLSDREDA